MAEASGVTDVGLKEKIIQSLGATHVEIEDMSGELRPRYPSMQAALALLHTERGDSMDQSSIPLAKYPRLE